MSPADVVQRQLDAYNARDLAAFLATYDDAITLYRLPATVPALTGKAELGELYATQRFNLPALHADLLDRIVMGNKVIDHERIHGVRDAPFEAVAAYEVRAGLIVRAWFLAPD